MTRETVPGRDLLAQMGARRGHFVMESGHHGELWLDLDGFFAAPSRLDSLLNKLAATVARFDPDLVCGPLTGGAFIAYALAARLGIGFRWTYREGEPSGSGLFPYRYRLAGTSSLAGHRAIVVDDVINAGSAASETVRLVREYGATPVALAALLTLGESPPHAAGDQGLELIALASTPNNLWNPAECPLCAEGRPVEPMGR